MSRLLRKPQPRLLVMESLECRAMLATASVAGGILRIVGNNSAENVSVTAGAVPGQFFVAGVSGFAGPFNNVIGINADMRNGNDTLSVGTSEEPVELLGGINVLLGNGSDRCNIRANTLGAVTIDGGRQNNSQSQNDIIDIDNSILASLIVNTWAGSDELIISDSAILTLVANLGVNSLVNGQTDSDEAFINSSAIGNAYITLGTANNGSPPANGGPVLQAVGFNYVDIGSTIFGSLSITGGNKTDVIYIGSTQECGIGEQLRSGLVDLLDDLEPLLNSLVNPSQILPLLNGIDGLLSQVGSALDIDLSDFDLTNLITQNEGDLSGILDDIFSALEEEGFDFCDIGAQTTIFSTLSINTLAGSDFVNVGQGQVEVTQTIPSIEDLIGNALSADVLVLGSIIIDTGDQNDTVELLNVFVGSSVTVLLGKGNDQLCVVDVTAAIASFNGGAGFDSLLFDFDGERDEETGYLAYSAVLFEFFGACFVD